MHPELIMILYWVPWVLHLICLLSRADISLYVNVWMNRLYLFSSGSLTPVSQMLPIRFTHNILIGRVTPSYLIIRNRVSNHCNFLVLGSEFRSLSAEASKMKPFLCVCLLLPRSATVVDWNWQYLLLWKLCMIHTIEGPLVQAKRRVWKSQLGHIGTNAVCRNWFRENDFPHEIHLHKVIACHQVPMKIHCWESALIAIKRSSDFC